MKHIFRALLIVVILLITLISPSFTYCAEVAIESRPFTEQDSEKIDQFLLGWLNDPITGWKERVEDWDGGYHTQKLTGINYARIDVKGVVTTYVIDFYFSLYYYSKGLPIEGGKYFQRMYFVFVNDSYSDWFPTEAVRYEDLPFRLES